MDISLFLAQLFALYFIATGVALMAKQEAMRSMARHMADQPMLHFAGFFTFILGSLLVLTHNVWDGSWHVLISIIAWLTFLKGLAYLWLPQKAFAKMLKLWDNKSWIMLGGLVLLILGLYLGYIGFLA